MAIRDDMGVGPGTVRQVRAAEGNAAPKLYTAKISQADRKNANNRIYPKSVLQANILRLQPLLASGHLFGALDHGENNMGDTAVKFVELQMDETGAVHGKFNVVGTKAGRDLRAMLDAKISVGFSTLGFGTGRQPTPAERAQYGLDEDEFAVVMNPDFILKKVDVVDDPACADARIKTESRRDEQRTAAEGSRKRKVKFTEAQRRLGRAAAEKIEELCEEDEYDSAGVSWNHFTRAVARDIRDGQITREADLTDAYFSRTFTRSQAEAQRAERIAPAEELQLLFDEPRRTIRPARELRYLERDRLEIDRPNPRARTWDDDEDDEPDDLDALFARAFPDVA